jgi:hypothetical protein
LKASPKQIIDAYVHAVELCNLKILESAKLHKNESEGSQAYETKKVIDKWFRNGGRL